MRTIRDQKLRALWEYLVSKVPDLGSSPLLDQCDLEMSTLAESNLRNSNQMCAIRTFTGLAILSRHFFDIPEKSKQIVVSRLSAHFEKNRDIHHLMGTVFEMQVACRLILAGYEIEFVPEKNREKRPDILVKEAQVLVECKNLSPRDLEITHVGAMCHRMKRHAAKAQSQFAAYDTTESMSRLAVFHLPPDPGGFFHGRHLSQRVEVSLAASGSESRGGSGTPGTLSALLVESSLTPLYDRPTSPNEPAEYWHVPMPHSLHHPSLALLVWHLFMSMNVCPYEGFRQPILAARAYLAGQSVETVKAMRPAHAMALWREWNVQTGSRFDEFELPPLSCFPFT